MMPGHAQGAAVQMRGAQSELAWRFRANSHERSAQTWMGLDRMIVRIGWHWAALRTTLLHMAEGPFLLRACHSDPENLPRRCVPSRGTGPWERSWSRVEGCGGVAQDSLFPRWRPGGTGPWKPNAGKAGEVSCLVLVAGLAPSTAPGRVPPEAEEQEALASLEPAIWRVFWRGSDMTARGARQDPGAALPTCGAQSDFARCFPASSHKRSLALSLVRRAERHRVHRGGIGRRGRRLRVPQLEAPKDRSLEMED